MKNIFLTSIVILLLTGCSINKPKNELKALDNFWKLLGGEQVKKESKKQ